MMDTIPAMQPLLRLFVALALALVLAPAGRGQEMSVEDYEPRSTLEVPEHPRQRAKYPFVDVHAHQRRLTPESVRQLVEEMDKLNMAVMVNLSGGSGDSLKTVLETLKGPYPDRFVIFANVRFDGLDDPDFGARVARQLEADVRAGAQGLKIFKNLGMFTTDPSGQRVPTDDPRLDPIWEKCAELGVPVLIHTGEPAPFWDDHDRFNERWLELKQFPNRMRQDARFASFEQTMGEQHNLFRRHPKTTFINAHLGWLGNDLDRLGRLLDELPNVYTEVGAVLAELGRQPRRARQFLIDYQDRVLFGKDSWNPEEYHVYFRTFETADEYFDYYRRRHAHWKIYGLDLPDVVLQKIYFRNALAIVPGINPELFAEVELPEASGR